MRLVTRESSKNEPRNELDSLVTSLVASLDSMSVPDWRRSGAAVSRPSEDMRRGGGLQRRGAG